jgi:hypothetical protein
MSDKPQELTPAGKEKALRFYDLQRQMKLLSQALREARNDVVAEVGYGTFQVEAGLRMRVSMVSLEERTVHRNASKYNQVRFILNKLLRKPRPLPPTINSHQLQEATANSLTFDAIVQKCRDSVNKKLLMGMGDYVDPEGTTSDEHITLRSNEEFERRARADRIVREVRQRRENEEAGF